MNEEKKKLYICPVENKEACNEGCTDHCEPHEYNSEECVAPGMPACIPVDSKKQQEGGKE